MIYARHIDDDTCRTFESVNDASLKIGRTKEAIYHAMKHGTPCAKYMWSRKALAEAPEFQKPWKVIDTATGEVHSFRTVEGACLLVDAHRRTVSLARTTGKLIRKRWKIEHA